MIKTCPHCNKEIICDKHQQFGAHITNCKSNPKHKNILDKIKQSKNNKNPTLRYDKLICKNCNAEYSLNIKKSYYNKDKYSKFCCKKCANKYSSSFAIGTKKLKCSKCDDIFDVNVKTSKIICDRCKAYKNDTIITSNKNNRIRIVQLKHEQNNTKIYKNSIIHINNHDVIVCACCGDEKCKCPDKCKNFKLIKTFKKYFNFNLNTLGTEQFYTEYDKIYNLLIDHYIVKEQSSIEISKIYGINFRTLCNIMENLNIKRRTFSDSQRNAIKHNRNTNPTCKYPYKTGFHITWFNTIAHYRSNFELDYYKKLDNEKIFYECEKLRISYFDTQKNINRIAIPDIFISNTNEIIEIKSKYTYNEINMNDKIVKYKELGYNFKLIIGYGKKLFDNYKEFIY